MQLPRPKFSSAFSLRGIVAFALLIALALLPARADQIVMKNGDRVTGSIVKKDGKNLTIKIGSVRRDHGVLG